MTTEENKVLPIVTLFLGDCLTLLADGLPAPEGHPPHLKTAGMLRADAGVTDPPYGFDFAGEKDWDTFGLQSRVKTAADDSEVFARFTERWSYGLRTNVLRPGAHLLAFTASRTIGPVDRGLQRAGYAIPRVAFWLYASGQVKNPNDLRPGSEPIFVGRNDKDRNGRPLTDRGLGEMFRRDGLGQLHAQTWKAEDGKHPTDVLIDGSLVEAYDGVAEMVLAHPGTFFVPKPSPKDRDAFCGDLPVQKKDNRLSHMTSNYTGKVVKDVMAQNVHPTVKPIELMRRLIRLVTRPGHVVIDPFVGSGTTGIAAVLEGRHFIGIEREPAYFVIAATRIAGALREVGHEEGALRLLSQAATIRTEHALPDLSSKENGEMV